MANIRFMSIVVNFVSTYDFYIWCLGWIKEGKSINENENEKKTNYFQKKKWTSIKQELFLLFCS